MTEIPPRRTSVSRPTEELVFQHSHLPGGEPETFQEQLREAFKSAPWFAVSAAIHALAYLILMNVAWSTTKISQDLALQAEKPPENVEVLDEPEPEEPEPEEPEEEEEIIEEPIISEEEVEQMLDEDPDRAPIDAPFEGRSLNDVIGAGGGAGGSFGGKYGRRGSGKGGGKASQKAVELGLEWLKRHQNSRGFWDCDDFSNECKENICDGRGNAVNDVGVTGIALLAFLGAGNTMTHGRYKDVVKNGLRWLKDSQNPDDGCFGPKDSQHFMYGHSLATLAMVEGYYLSRQPLLKTPAQRGIDFIARSRNPYKAWRYDYPPSGDNDSSVSGWMLFALFAALDAELNVDQDAIKDGMAFMDEMTDPATYRTGYQNRGSYPARTPEDQDIWPPEKSEALTAVSLLVRFFHKQDPDSPLMKGQADLLVRKPPVWDEAGGTIDYYYWYYGSYAMWQMSGRWWDQWQKKMIDSIVEHQRPDGDERGSWDPQFDPWGDDGGRVYATAINTLCLEVYYRYDKIIGAR